MSEEVKFDIQIVGDKFRNAIHNEDDVQLKQYLEGFEELNKFFLLMGSIFGFICDDVKEKIELLYNLLNDTENSNFTTVKKMIEHEKNNHLLNKKDYVSGSRTLLRLHRGLDFIQVFLKKLSELSDDESTSRACREAYDDTLGKFHPFLIRTGARIAIYTLPTKDVLLKKVCGNEEDIKRAITHLPETLLSTSIVYKNIEDLYTIHNLHILP